MKSVSVGAAWTDSLVFLRREAALMIPVVLLFIAVPLDVILQVVPQEIRTMGPGVSTQPPVLPASSQLLVMISLPLMLVGILVSNALALKPGISVREALQLGLRSTPAALGAALIIGIGVAVPAMFVKAVSPVVADVLIVVAMIVASARLLFVNAVVVDQRTGPIETLRRSWKLSGGNFLRLLVFAIGIGIPILLAQMVAETLIGVPVALLAGKEAGMQAGDLAASVALALGQMIFVVMASRLYRQLVPNG